jgi:flavin reductase (DIM6/NTAB) family NADH-FMN oxidoreductase RutF
MFYEPSLGHPFRHNPFKALVAPRPIGWIATRSKSGAENLSPYSFFNAISDEPPIIVFSSDGEKDSLSFAREAGCFVAHSVSAALFDAMNQSSAAYARGVSEIEATGLASVDAERVDAPRLVDAPSALECIVTQIMQPLDKDGVPSRYHMVFGQVVGVHIHDDYVTEDGRFDSSKASLMARCGYLDYAVASTITAKSRPKQP